MIERQCVVWKKFRTDGNSDRPTGRREERQRPRLCTNWVSGPSSIALSEGKGGRWRRADPSSRIIIWGGGIFAPAVTGWFGALQRIPIQSKWPSALVKTGLDQFAFAPIAISGTSSLHFLYAMDAGGKRGIMTDSKDSFASLGSWKARPHRRSRRNGAR